MNDEVKLKTAEAKAAGTVLAGFNATPSSLSGATSFEHERWFWLMAQVSPVLIWVTDKSGHIVYGNHACRDFFGSTPTQISERDEWQAYIHPDDYGAYVDAYREAVKHNKSFVAEVRLKHLNGQWRYLATYAAPYYNTIDGGFAGFVGSSPDVTERVELDQHLIEADHAKDRFIAMLGHELRNPLAPIITAVSILKKSTALPDPQRKAVEIIGRQVNHLARLVDDLVDVQRIINNKVAMRMERLPIGEVISAAIESSQPNLEKRGQCFAVELPQDEVYVRGDSLRLCQVFTNLINNAAKFSPNGTCITVVGAAVGEIAKVTVRDEGIGMESDELSRIFGVFVQISGSGEPHAGGGLGLGLAVAKGLVELHGGSIEARSAGKGKGSELIVSLPRA